MNVPQAPPKDPRLRRHTTGTMQLARRMYGNGDSWTPTQIRTYFADRGTDVSLNTVRIWVIPGIAAEQRKQNTASYHRRQGAPPPSATPILDRMLELRSAGLTFTAIASVVRLDLGLPLDREQARYYVNARREPVQPKRRAA